MPAGNFTISLWLRRTLPLPLQRLHGVRMILPVPRQSGQAAVDCIVMPMKFCCVRTEPVPLQRGQVSALVPGAAPLPWHWSQSSTRETVTSFSAPKAASSNVSSTRAPMSSPCMGALALRRVLRPPPPKKLPKISPRSPKSPNPAPPNGLPPAFGLKFGSTPAKPYWS